MKTGNTHQPCDDLHTRLASMEPGHEDREYLGHHRLHASA